MPIKMRSGLKKDLRTNKLEAGEFAVPLDTKEVFACFKPGDTKRMATYEDMVENIESAAGDVIAGVTSGLNAAITDAKTETAATRTATTNANAAATGANSITAEAKTVLDNIKKTDFSKMQEELANLFPGGTQIFRGTNTDIPLVTGNAVWKNGEWIRVGIAVANTTNISTVNSPNPNIIYGWRMEKTGTAADSGVRQNTIPLVIGQEYTLSCYARGITEGAHFKFQYGISGNWRNQGQNITGNWERYSVTFVPTTANTDIIIGLNTTYTGIVEICGAKLESGNKATDWSQSPWDIENAINSVAISPSTSVPRATGAASAGAEAAYSRGDHVHPAQTSITGNAGSATKLQTARTINGVAFDGTGNIEILPTINTGLSFAGQTGGREVFCRRVGKMVFINGYFTSTGTGTVSLNNLPRTAENVRFTAAGVSGGATRLISCTISNNATSVNFTQITADTAYVFNFSYVAA